jgi:hypothetical protein
MVERLDIDVFHGELSAHAARIYVRAVGLPGGKEWSIAGRVRGPECRYARTLPTNHPLTDLGAGELLLAQATIPDPCFWSPELPALYRVSIELRRRTIGGNEEVAWREERELGLRWLGPRGKSLYLEGKRWVLRGIGRQCVGEVPLSSWREAGAAMLVEQPPDELCREAAREGVFLVSQSGADRAELRRVARWASVGIAAGSLSGPEIQRSCPNLILAGSDDPDSGGSRSDAGRDEPHAVRFVDADRLAAGRRGGSHGSGMPLIAVRRVAGVGSLDQMRAEVDRLQSDLAPHGDFAGYVIDRLG